MKKFSMRLLGFLLMAVMMVSLFAVGVFAEDTANVAKVGDTEYATLQQAITAAKAGETVTLLADVSGDVTVSKTLTLDGAGFKFTGNISVSGTSTAATVKNVNFVDGTGYAITTNRITSITVENCTVTNYGYGFLYANKATPTVVVKDVTVTGGNYGFHWVYGTNATLENVTMTDVAYGVMTQNYGAKTITLKDCSIDADTSIRVWARNTTVVDTFKLVGTNDIDFSKVSIGAVGNFVIEDDNGKNVDVVAMVGSTFYKREGKEGETVATIVADAFAKAQNGDEVVIFEAGTYAVPTGKNITVTSAVDGVVFDNIGAKNMGGANVTFNNVTFDYYPNVTYTGLQHSGNLVYNNCIINGQVFMYGQSETFNNCTFNQNSADAYNVWTYGAKEVAFNKCTFNSVGKSVLIYSDQAGQTNDVSFTACTLNASAPADGKAAIEMDSSIQGYINLTIDADTTVEGFGIGNVSGNSLWNNKKNNLVEANNDITVVVDGVTVLEPLPLVAELNGVKYTSLQGALDKAQSGDTITLLADVTLSEKLTITGDVTIEGAYTITRGDAYTGTLFTVNAGATLTLDGGLTIDGGNAWTYTVFPPLMDMNNGAGTSVAEHITPAEGGVDATAHMIVNNGTLNVLSVTIENSYSTGNFGLINAGANSVTILDGATIRHTAANRSGAVANIGGNDAILTIKGTTRITDNFGVGNGGIIQNYGQGTTVNLEGGSIDNNFVGKSGALYASYSSKADKINTFNMTGGIITENVMEGYGPVYIHTNTVWNMSGGEISKNVSYLPSYVRNNNPAGSMTGGKIANNEITGLDYSGGYYLTRPDLRLNGKTAITGGIYSQNVFEYIAPNTGVAYDDGLYTVVSEGLYKLHLTDPVTGEPATIPYIEGNVLASLVATGKLFYADYYEMTLEVLYDVKIDETVVIDYPMTIDLNGYTITGYSTMQTTPVFRVVSDVTVIGEGKVDGRPGSACYAFIVGQGENAGNLTIENGTFYGDISAISVTKGTATINGGNFAVTPYQVEGKEDNYNFLLNCIDKNYKDDTAKIVVKGGTFYKFNPAANAAEGAGTDFVPETHISVDNGDGTFTVWKAVAKVGDTYFATLQDAFAACTNGETITLLVDLVYDADDAVPAHGGATGFGKYDQYNPSIIYIGGTKGATEAENQPSNVNAVLDLNGHTITNNADAYLFLFMDNCKVTIKDSKDGDGIINYANLPIIWACGTDTLVTIENGKYYNGNEAYGSLIHSTHAADIVIKGGEFKTALAEAPDLLKINTQKFNNPNYFLVGKATMTVTGGTFYGFNPEYTGDTYTKTDVDTVPETHAVYDNGDGSYTVMTYIEWIKQQLLLGNDVVLEKDIVVDGSMIESIPASTNGNGRYPSYGIFNVVGDYDVTFDLNGHSITYNGHESFEWNGKTVNSCTVAHGLFFANDGAHLTIVGEGDVIVNGVASGVYSASPDTAITIQGGNWVNNGCAECGATNLFLYASHGGELYIEGGRFEQALDSEGNSYLIVVHGGEYKNSVIDYAKTKIVVTGGTFVGMNPNQARYFYQSADNKTDMSQTTNVVALGYAVEDKGNGVWTIVDAVAHINGIGYVTLADAIAAVQNGETIVLLADIDEDVTIEQQKDLSFTIDGADKTYTGTMTINGDKRSAGAETLTVKNVNFVATEQYQKSIAALKNTYAHNVTIDNCTFTATGDAENTAYAIHLRHVYNFKITNTTGSKLLDLVYGQNAVTGLTVENVTVTDSGMGFMLPYGVDLSFKNVTIEAEGAGVAIYNYGDGNRIATFENCTITANPPIFYEEKGTLDYTLVFKSENKFVNSSETEDHWLNVNKLLASEKLTIDLSQSINLTVDGISYDTVNYTANEIDEKIYNFKYIPDVAQIGDVKYKTLADAIAAVQNGETIVLLADIDENVTITQKAGLSFTIDGAGKTYTGTIKVNGSRRSTGKETLTIQNVKFVQDTAGQIFIEAVSNTYAHNITVDDCTFTGTDKTAYGIFLCNAYNITMKNSSGSGLLDMGYSAKAVTGFAVENVTVTDSVNGFYMSYVINASFKDVKIEATNVGIYVNNNNASTATIEDCTITAANPVVIQERNTTKTYKLVFKGTNTFTAGEGNSWLTVVGQGAMVTVDLTGATYLDINEVTFDENYYSIFKTKTENVYDIDARTNAVAAIGDSLYKTLQAALNDAKNGETIILLKDLVYGEDDIVAAIGGATGFGDFYNPAINYVGGTRVDGVNSPSDINAVLDLNGYTITNNADAYLFLFMDNCKITIKDSKDGDGMISNTEYPLIWVVGTETLVTIENGKYNTVSTSGLIHVTHGGDLVINGGEFRTSADDASSLIVRNDRDRQNSKYFIAGKATVTVYGGTFYGFDPENTPDDNENSAPFFNAVAEGYMSYEIESNVWVVVPADSVVMLKTEGSDEVKFFNSIAAAMAEARVTKATDTVYLMKDHEESVVIIYDGTTLDLRDKTLTADYVVSFNGGYLTGNPCDASESGARLIVPKQFIVLAENAAVSGKGHALPVWREAENDNNGEFVFAQMAISVKSGSGVKKDAEGKDILYIKFGINGTGFVKKNYLFNQDVSGFHVEVVAVWNPVSVVNGETVVSKDTITQVARFDDEQVTKVATSNTNFTASVALQGHENLTLYVRFVTDAGVVIESAPLTVN